MIYLFANSISFAYPGKPLFENFSMQVKSGDWIAIIGNNGSGKTTLLKVLAGLITPQSGEVVLGTHQMPFQLTERAYVGQHDFSRYGSFPATALEIVMSAYTPQLGLFKHPTHQMAEQAKAMLDKMGLEKEHKSRLADLSGGQQQRVFIAKALLLNPKILFLDEPASALDSAFTEKLYEILEQYRLKGMAIVMITHDLKDAHEVASRVFCVGPGDVLQLNPPQIHEELAHRHVHNGDAHEHF